jgi:hypothetical protein
VARSDIEKAPREPGPPAPERTGRCTQEKGALGPSPKPGRVAIGWRAELMEPGYECEVIAPAKFARRPRDRIKTDRRDALLLARQTRAGELVKVAIPDARDEALRDLSRTREDASDVEGQHRADDPTAEQEGAEQLEIYCECNELSVLKTACRPSVASVFPGVA